MSRIPGKRGFAMPLVLVLVAILTLTFAVALFSLRGLRDQTLLAVRGADFEAQAMTAEARMAYLMTTEPFGAASLDIGADRAPAGANSGGQGRVTAAPAAQLFMDSRPYRWRAAADGSGPVFLAQVQDEAGLVNISQADLTQLWRLFISVGLSESDAQTLADETVQYLADPTAHLPMRKASELYRLENAPRLLTEKVWRRLMERAVVYPDNRAININTAPAEVLQVLFDLSDIQAQDIVRNREGQVLASTADIGVVVADTNRNYAFTGGRLRFSFTDPVTGLTRRSTLVLTPNSGVRPLWVENAETLALPPPETNIDELDEFPQIPDLAS